jgi:hypothetical protein
MRAARLLKTKDGIGQEIESIYGFVDLDLGGKPTVLWERRNLRVHRLDEPLQHAFYPDVWVHKILVSRRMSSPLGLVMHEINTRWTPEVRKTNGLNQFVKCYCFGDGEGPNLFWYGAAWELSPKVEGGALTDATKIFSRHGFSCPKPRVFEYW